MNEEYIPCIGMYFLVGNELEFRLVLANLASWGWGLEVGGWGVRNITYWLGTWVWT